MSGERPRGTVLSEDVGRMSAVGREIDAAAGTGLRPYERLTRRPWFLAPPRRVGGNLHAEVLTLHTIQTRVAYETLRRDGTLVGDPALGEADFTEAYSWMRKRMARRLSSSGDGILWLWAKTTYRDLIGSTRYGRGEVLLTVRVPRERVLLSHFDDWHSVLNRSLEVPLLLGETYEQWLPRFDSIRDGWDQRERVYRDLSIDQWPAALRAELESSWDSIFDLGHRTESFYVQATVHELRAHEVSRVVRIM